MIRIKYILAAFILLLSCGGLRGQGIVMRAEVHEDKVMLRWTSTDARAWRLLNQHGVRLERLTVVRDGAVIDQPERIILHDGLKPEDTPVFRLAAQTYPFAAIIAQAVFGEDFIVSGSRAQDIETIIALSDELQQRYVLSLYAADLCFPAAEAAGWGWVDYNVRSDERYLYNVIPLDAQGEIGEGALFVDAARIDRFPAPLDFDGRFMDGSVMLSWNYRTQEATYNAYMPERSTDGVNFVPISDIPITRMDAGEGSQITFADSIANGTTYYYRLAGLTPFGTRGAYSDTISGRGMAELRNPPFITKAIPDMNGGVDIEWAFEEEDEKLIGSFTLERSDDDKTYIDHIASIDPARRSITVPDIPATNYFVIAANTLSGKRIRSFAALVQPVDSLPPAVPAGLAAFADTTGTVRLSWRANGDADILGYRVFRGQTHEEEMIPLNDIALTDTLFVDSIDLNMLNATVYYAVAALDQRYNQSDKSEVVGVVKPETIPPTPPFIRSVKVDNGRNVITWVSGGEDNLAGYDLMRKADDGFTLLAALDGVDNCTYEDTDVQNGVAYTYRVMSRSRGGLLSEPSPDYPVRAVSKSTAKSQIVFDAVPRKEGFVALSWNIPIADAVSVQLYRRTDEGSFTLLREGLEASGKIEDGNVVPGTKYHYMIVVKSNAAAPQTAVKSAAL